MTHVTFVHGIGNKPEPRALLDLWRRKLAQGAGAIDLGDAGVESTMVYWTDVLYERPDPDLAAFEKRRWGWCGEIPRGSSWDSLPKVRFAPDSPLEGTGFELLVRGRVKLVVGRRRQRNRTARRSRCRCTSWPSISSYPAPGQEGKGIVVLDRWAEDRTEGAVSSLARSRPVSVL